MPLYFREGEPISASKFNQLAQLAERPPQPGWHAQQGQIADASQWEGWIRITNTYNDHVYDWKDVIFLPDGSLVDGYRSGLRLANTGAREVNNNNEISIGTIVRAWSSGFEVHFQMDLCE